LLQYHSLLVIYQLISSKYPFWFVSLVLQLLLLWYTLPPWGPEYFMIEGKLDILYRLVYVSTSPSLLHLQLHFGNTIRNRPLCRGTHVNICFQLHIRLLSSEYEGGCNSFPWLGRYDCCHCRYHHLSAYYQQRLFMYTICYR
jgi:hypothetical protein